MREYLPILIVAGIIGLFAAAFLTVFLLEKNKKESMGFERHMADREIIRRLLAYARPYRKNFLPCFFLIQESILRCVLLHQGSSLCRTDLTRPCCYIRSGSRRLMNWRLS